MTGPLRLSAAPSGRGAGALDAGRAGRGRGGADWLHAGAGEGQGRPDREGADRHPSGHEPPSCPASPGTPVPFLNVARTRPLMLLISSATFDSKPVPWTTAPAR